MRLILPLVALFLCSASLAAETSQELAADIKKFAAAVRETIGKKAPEQEKSRRGDIVASVLMQLNRGPSEDGMVDETLAVLRPYLDQDPLREQCDALILRYRTLRSEQAKADAERMRAVLQRAIAAVRAAKLPEDLDAAIGELAEFKDYQSLSRSENPETPELIRKAQLAFRFTESWQSYLSAVEADDGARASQMLENLSRDGWPEAMPRSQILGRMWKRATPRVEPPPSPSPAIAAPVPPEPVPLEPAISLTSILQTIKTPEDLSSAAAALAKLGPDGLQPFGPEGPLDVQAAQQAVADLDNAYRSFIAGLAFEISSIKQTPVRDRPVLNLLIPVRAQLLTLVLPRHLRLPDGYKAAAGEGPIPFLERISQEAQNRGDYLLVFRAQNALEIIRGNQSGMYDGTAPAGSFLIGVNQEEGGQYALAVTSLEKALGSSNPVVPPKVIGERLAAIKAAHPEEFQQGLDNYLLPPESRFPGPFGRRPGPPGYGPPFGDRPAPPKPPALSVPAVAPSPAPAASPKP